MVNATPVGMSATSTEGHPWLVDPALLGPSQVAVDLVYDPPRTPWLAAARARGATVVNGIGMLVHQAALQVERWTEREVPVEAMWRAVADRAAGPRE